MKKLLPLNILLIIFLITSCGAEKEDPIAREQKEIKEYLDNAKTLIVYKGVKIALRTDYTSTSKEDSKITEAGLKALKPVSDLLLNTEDVKKIGIVDIYNLYTSLNDVKEELSKVEEDSLPTILDKVSQIEKAAFGNSSDIVSSSLKSVLGEYNNSTEHFILSALLFCIPSAPKDMYTYEALKINPNELASPDMHILSQLIISVTCLEHKWNYTSEKTMNEYITYLEANKKEVLDATDYIDTISSMDKEKRYYDFHAIGYAMRGLSKIQSDREDEGYSDLDVFVDDLEKANQMSKELYFAATYISIKNNKADKANKCITILEKDSSITSEEKETIKKLKTFLESNKEDKDLNDLMDKYVIYKIIAQHAYTVATQSEISKSMKKNEYGAVIFELPEKINSGINQTGSTIINTADSVKNKAKELFNGIFK